MEIAIINGKGLDGCGVTRGAHEVQIWAEKTGHIAKVYSLAERKFARGDGHGIDNNFFTVADIPSLRAQLEQVDIVYLNSYPAATNSKEAIDGFFYELVLKLEKPVIMGFMHELTTMNINKIPHLLGILNACDVIFNFSEKTYFSTNVSTLLPSKKLGERIKRFTMWQNFTVTTEKLRDSIPLSAKKKELLYASRWTSMKDPRRVLDLGPLLREHEIDTRLIGIERSIGAKGDIFDHPYCLDLSIKGKQLGNLAGTPVEGPYMRQYGLEQMANSLFNCSFYRMPKDPNGYGWRMEYAQIEMIAVGSLPVFDLHWAQHNGISDGTPFSEIEHSGIYSDKANLAETVEKLVEVSKTPSLQKLIRNTSYDIIRAEYDAEIILPKMFEEVLAIGKDRNKFKSIEEMLLNITRSEDYVEKYLELNYKGQLVALGLEEPKKGIIAVFDGKKRVEAAKFKLPQNLVQTSAAKKSILEF
jgi:hypothetical protein